MHIQATLLAFLLLVGATTSAKAQANKQQKKALVVYYSLHNGNTRIVAEKIQKQVGADLFRIETVQAYPAAYNDVTAQAKKELESNYRPPLKKQVKNIQHYETIYLGSPNWWNTVAPAVMTFLESHNLEGKTIVPFITHEGSRLGSSLDDIRKLAPKATVRNGLPVRGSAVNDADADIKKWLQNLGLLP